MARSYICIYIFICGNFRQGEAGVTRQRRGRRQQKAFMEMRGSGEPSSTPAISIPKHVDYRNRMRMSIARAPVCVYARRDNEVGSVGWPTLLSRTGVRVDYFGILETSEFPFAGICSLISS